MDRLRFQMVKIAAGREAVPNGVHKERPPKYFGEQVFNRSTMQHYLSQQTFETLTNAIDQGLSIEREVADEVAEGMLKWAKEKGATHYTHWFQPLTGGTAEKHDLFTEFDEKKDIIEHFSGKLLIQQEPDASSFPSGGIRNTFEARGYSAWDASSPAFILDDCLCIPTIFVAYTGEALDYKTPLLRSIHAVDCAAKEVCNLFNMGVKKVYSYLGWEQEFFLIDRALYTARPDLMLTGRTLIGHESAKNQQLEDHYFGSIPTRVVAFMKDLEYEALRLGIPLKTRHNETAPNQFELAPIYEEANLANDHNLLLMSLMKKIARRHNLRALLHEKPFKGVNGSGKHCNWSLGTDSGVNLLSLGKTAEENFRFTVFLVIVLKAVHKYNGLLKASIASATNAQRLGANEAPPSIISCFLGGHINALLDKIENATKEEEIDFKSKSGLKIGLSHVPEILLDNTDRNRTSPFAFTGNRFEFRGVGASDNCGASMICLNTAVASQLIEFKSLVEEEIKKGEIKEVAIFHIIQSYIKESKPIRFDGNGYSSEWKEEAKERGLDVEQSVPLLFDRYMDTFSTEAFTKMKVLDLRELKSRCEVKWETYTNKILIELRVFCDLASNHILPAATKYQGQLLQNLVGMKSIFSEKEFLSLSEQSREEIKTLSACMKEIHNGIKTLYEIQDSIRSTKQDREKAIMCHDRVVPLLEHLRKFTDQLELIVDDELWSLPKYRELLFIR